MENIYTPENFKAMKKDLKLKDRHGGNIDEFPENLKVRQFPKSKIF